LAKTKKLKFKEYWKANLEEATEIIEIILENLSTGFIEI